jgi:hypothetical protein
MFFSSLFLSVNADKMHLEITSRRPEDPGISLILYLLMSTVADFMKKIKFTNLK